MGTAQLLKIEGEGLLTELSGPEVAYSSGSAKVDKAAMAKWEDCDLVERAANGDEAAFEILMARHSPLVIGFLYGKTAANQDSEDLGQEIFLAAFRYLKNLHEPKHFKAWLMRIARSKLYDYYRLRKRMPQVTTYEGNPENQREDLLSRLPDPSPGPDEQAGYAQIRNLVMRAIDGIGAKYRSILYLRLLGDEPAKDIALRLGLKESTVRMRLLRGMKSLRKTLKRQGIAVP